MANENYDYSDIERQLRDYAKTVGREYHDSDLGDVKRNSGYDDPSTYRSPEEAMRAVMRKYDEWATNVPGQEPGKKAENNSGGGGQESVAQQWNNHEPSAEAQQNTARRDELFNLLMSRATQGLNVDRLSNPAIRAQSDAYRANEERTKRGFLADLAERSGPFANLTAESRLASERVGQRTGAFEAQLTADEIRARRDEIAQALAMASGMLSQDQQVALQRELSMLNTALAREQMALTGRGLDQDWQRALLQNQQYMAQLGFQAEDRATYYDLVRRGLI